MNCVRFSTVGHRDHIFYSPLSSAKVDKLVTLLDLPTASRVLDVGCGKGEILLRILQRYGATGDGVDTNPEFLREAGSSAEARGLGANVKWHTMQAADFSVTPESYDVALCIGSTHAYGRFSKALAALAAAVRRGGLVLIADGFWRRPPTPEYLAVLGVGEDAYFSHANNEAAGFSVGLVPLYSCVSSEDEWDDYEGLYCCAVERFVRDHPTDLDAEGFQARIRTWRNAYRRWGRDTLGFGCYLFAKLHRPAGTRNEEC